MHYVIIKSINYGYQILNIEKKIMGGSILYVYRCTIPVFYNIIICQ